MSSGSGRLGPLPSDPPLPDPVEFAADHVNRLFVARLRRLGIPVTSHFYAGTHDFPYFQRELHNAFPMLRSELE